ncbi:hypothetical protein CC1G_02725 [Coprinopsis cinerea okayama7|uniref:BTB domain-containing protein n=1 Tax=Coprinopsis cinerea (strain Okayama-7 / 130 / ATCC MYA-4618 / FGSC 9003) TaxID=240176 RepID=A8PBS8_COPC7|nr:hypothetical protein CC1G_02725 [Coprinopsis cinerea okayama7\|eukprot:XP_001840262.2 hypothetical protein CC1G_02725 [Coprinopsis cinerea okayama7\
MADTFVERVSPVAVIKGILSNYPFSVGILRELLQNSDDAKAKLQTFVLDCRTHGTNPLQGPALLAFNDAQFSKDDWVALQNISESSKREDTSKIGKFGIGIRSCYHVTDHLQILSGDTLVTFDPTKSLFKEGASVVTLSSEVDETATERLRPFSRFVGANWTGGPFDGTVVRLPLRTTPSELQTKVATTEEIGQLMKDFVRDELKICMLFLQHLRSINLIMIDDQGETELGSSTIESNQIYDNVDEKLVTLIDGTSVTKRRWIVQASHFADEDAIALLAARTGGLSDTLLKRHKLRPHVGIAFPLDGDDAREVGQLFTYLRLPLSTGFPAHVHAFFALTPSRQNLKNQGDPTLMKGSDDHLLVEWNKLLFDIFIPRAWGHLLSSLVQTQCGTDVFKAWPLAQSISWCGESIYWNNFPHNVLSSAIEQQAQVWPVHGSSPLSHKILQGVFVATTATPTEVLDILSSLGFSITRPPAYITQMLQSQDYSNRGVKFLTPDTAATELKTRKPDLAEVNHKVILEYLLSTGNLSNIVGIEIIPTIANRLVALENRGSTTISHTLLEEFDAQLFRECDDQAIPLHEFSTAVSSLLRRLGPNSLNVKLLDVGRVVEYLSLHPTRVGRDLASSQPDSMAVEFLSDFWVWFEGWGMKNQLRPMLSTLYLLPCTHGLREANSPVFSTVGRDPVLVKLLEGLGVPFLSSTFKQASEKVLRNCHLVVDIDNIHALLNTLSHCRAPTLSESDAKLILGHITTCHARSVALRGSLTNSQRDALRRLPIFPVLHVDETTARKSTVWQSLESYNSIQGISSNCIVPVIPKTAFLPTDIISPSALSLAGATTTTLSPLGVLDLTLQSNRLQHQSPAVLEDIMAYLATRRIWINDNTRRALMREKIVYNASGTLCAPEDLIDPSNPLYTLYSSDPVRIPSTSDETRAKICKSASTLGLFDAELSSANVMDRVNWIAANADNPSFVSHSLKLLEILEARGFNCCHLNPSIRTYAWLPTQDGCLVPSTQCRPATDDPQLFDQVLKTFHPNAALPSSLIRHLRWNQELPVNVLTDQMRILLQGSPSCQQIVTLLKALGQRTLLSTEQGKIREVLSGRLWVPTSHYELVEPSQVVFNHSIPEAGIFVIAPALSKDKGASRLLRLLGCSESPSFDMILAALNRLSNQPPSQATASAAISLLKFVTANGDLSDTQRSQLLVPDDGNRLRSKGEVVFNDIGQQAILVQRDGFDLAHPLIDNSLAITLRLDRLGLKYIDLQEEFEDMGATAVTLVQKAIAQYTEKQFLSEFLANAEDAGATRFSVVLNEGSGPAFTSKKLLSTEMEKFYNCPSVLVYNDGVFSDNDFRGLCKTHIGGKKDNPSSIGQFGLGALTMFHFAEIAVVLSGKYVLFLDPSKSSLPVPRASIKLPLKDLVRWYPDHLLPFDGCGLPDIEKIKSSGEYPGTIFFLPLRSGSHCSSRGISQKTCSALKFHNLLSEFRETAAQNLLFIRLAHIEVSSRHVGSPRSLWKVTATRTPYDHDGFTFIDTVIDGDGKRATTKWLIVSSSRSLNEVPEEVRYEGMKHIRTGLAACLSSKHPPPSKFFSTLALAIGTTLPVHVNASFFLSPDRRQIRHDAYANKETRFNQWLLSDPLPQAYLVLLEEIAKSRKNDRWWPENYANYASSAVDDVEPDDILTSNQDDALTSTLIRSFYSLLPSTERRILTPRYAHPSRSALKVNEAVFQPTGLPDGVKRVLDITEPLYLTKPAIRSRVWREARFSCLTPEHVKDLILGGAVAAIQSTFSNDERRGLLSYLCSSDPLNLRGLPLLRLQSKEYTTFESSGQDATKFIWESSAIVESPFPLSSFVAQGALPSDVILSARKSGLNIAVFDLSAVENLTRQELSRRSPLERKNWITVFWKAYRTLPGGRDLHLAIESLPLVPSISDNFVSLRQCKDDNVLVASALDQEDRLELIQDFGVTVVSRDRCPSALAEILRMSEYHKSGPFFHRALRCFQSNLSGVISCLSAWPDSRRKEFSKWFRSQLYTKPPKGLLPTARQLPVWPARRLASKDWKAASEIRCLPSDLDVSAAELLDVWVCKKPAAQHLGVETLSVEELKLHLRLPHILSQPDESVYLPILSKILYLRKPGAVKVPNMNRVMVSSKVLYSREALFEAAFKQDPTKFLLRSYSALEGQLRQKQLINRTSELNMSMFTICAQALHDSDDDEGDKVERARVLFRVYGEDLPLKVSAITFTNQWDQLDHLRFIPRSMSTDKTHGGWTLPVPSRVAGLPEVVSPRELVRREFEDIAWTQLASFAQQPNQRVLLANDNLGRPSLSNVLAHLRALCKMRPGPDVLHYLKSTYAWLNAIASENTTAIEQLNQESIFLNIDNPNAFDTWRWTPAYHMAFENHDLPTIHRVRPFLLDYKDLLKAAGVQDVVYPDVDTSPAKENTDEELLKRMRTGFAKMRDDLQFTDVVFTSEEDESTEKPQQFFAHRNFLSVFSGYFRDMFTGSFAEAQQASVSAPHAISLPYSNFAIQTVLDYLYTGSVINPKQPDLPFEDLLQALELSHYLDIKSLFDNIQLEIIKRRLIDPLTLENVKGRADTVQATRLSKYCDDYARSNRDYIRRIQQDAN